MRERSAHDLVMFTVTDEQAAAIRRVFLEQGELPAMIEFRRHFPGITDNARARNCAKIIAGWQPPARAPGRVIPLRSSRSR